MKASPKEGRNRRNLAQIANLRREATIAVKRGWYGKNEGEKRKKRNHLTTARIGGGRRAGCRRKSGEKLLPRRRSTQLQVTHSSLWHVAARRSEGGMERGWSRVGIIIMT